MNIQPELQPDYGQQTVEILKILIRSVNDPSPGATPEFPQFPGPSQVTVQVQGILYSSLGVALFSAFLAMLGKQWLNRYTIGSIADRCHYRQRKLDGMTTWYFHVLMESLPVMLQLALLLLGCALSLYLWGLQRTVSGVVIGITSLGVLFYIFIVVAGALYASCPYQTPGSQIIHRTWEKTLSTFITRFSTLSSHLTNLYRLLRPTDPDHRPSRALNINGYSGPESTPYVLDSDCIAWILETPLSGTIHVTALEFLATLPFFQRTNPAVIIRCLDILSSCIDMGNGGWAVVIPGSEVLANAAATAFLHILVQLYEAGSGSLDELCQRYRNLLSEDITFTRPPPITITVLHFCLHDTLHRKFPTWPKNSEHSPLTLEAISKALIVRSKKLRRARGKVPRWILRFVFETLTQPALPSDAIISNCFHIVSEDLGGSVTADER